MILYCFFYVCNLICNFSNIPDWLKGALMNELYFVADGGTIWFDVPEEYPETDPRFVLLEHSSVLYIITS